MIQIVHNVPEIPSEFPELSAVDVQENGTLVVFSDRAGAEVRAVFAPGTWAGLEIVP